MYQPITPKSLIKNSSCLKILMLIMMICTTCIVIEGILFATTDCGYSYTTYYTCYDNYYYRPNQCRAYDSKTYCCDSYYSTCGDQAHCAEKFKSYGNQRQFYLCYGHYYAMNCFIALSVILSIIIIVQVFRLRNRAKREEQMRLLRLQVANPIMYQPPVIQPQYQVAAPTLRQHIVNESTEEWVEEPMRR